MQTFETGVRYTLYHAFALFVVVWFRTAGPDQVSETIAGAAFIAGIVLFGGSLIALSLTGERRWGAMTPHRRRVLPGRLGGADRGRADGAVRSRAGAPGTALLRRRMSVYFFCASSRAFWYSAMTFCARCVGSSS